ncbi:hypothetical protein ACFONL_11480 [Camelimonas fluminis]|uniref:GcrA cell cycle regulator n=1 Tax=Camelimonas fluminis TaxID=1576911 RepID=A0ABV7UHR8_9HYPH|nr:hypothetical protein [Camelimonas fluminis]
MTYFQPEHGFAAAKADPASANVPLQVDSQPLATIPSRMKALVQAGHDLRGVAKSLGISRNKAAFLAFRAKISLKPMATRPPPSANFHPTLVSRPSDHVHAFTGEEVSVLRDLIARQGCSIETAARTMTIMARRPITQEEIISACHALEIRLQASIRHASVASPSHRAPITLHSAPEPAPTAEEVSVPRLSQAQHGVSIMALASSHCRSVIGRNTRGLPLYCAQDKKPGSSFCPSCHSRFFVPPPVVERPRPRAAFECSDETPVNRYRAVARAMQARKATRT